jgi:hypothetical protein
LSGTQSQNTDFAIRSDYYAGFFQNDWKVSPKLILNEFPLWKLGTFQFRGEAINLLSHPVYTAPFVDPTKATPPRRPSDRSSRRPTSPGSISSPVSSASKLPLLRWACEP